VATSAIFISLTVLFVLLAFANWLDSHVLHVIAGVEGIICGSLAMHTGIAEVLNEIYGRALLSIGAPQKTQSDLPAAAGH
jgi:succinate-acetate transporter protein